MGLGLYISKQIVKKFNGDIDFVSRPQKGSTFIFKMDLEFDEEQDF
jgi:signal transduction histidine kinase